MVGLEMGTASASMGWHEMWENLLTFSPRSPPLGDVLSAPAAAARVAAAAAAAAADAAAAAAAPAPKPPPRASEVNV
eukprot:scaffold4264_cov116-Isochrysis_galbana.AAC.19